MNTRNKRNAKPAKKGTVRKNTARRVTSERLEKTGGGRVARGKTKDVKFNSLFLKNLQEKQKELREILGRLKSSRMEYDGQLNAGDFIDEIDDAEREISAHKHYSLIERKHKELRNIEALIDRIMNEEEFGLCEECGTRIPKERLLIVPETTLCVSCQRELEKWDQRLSVSSGGSSAYGRRKDIEWNNSGDMEDDENLLMEFQVGPYPISDSDEAAAFEDDLGGPEDPKAEGD